jgi:hypothetical protein
MYQARTKRHKKRKRVTNGSWSLANLAQLVAQVQSKNKANLKNSKCTVTVQNAQ